MNRSFEQCCDEVAKEKRYKDWEDLLYDYDIEEISQDALLLWTKEASELYAQEKAKQAWDKAIEEDRKLIARKFNTKAAQFNSIRKPEFPVYKLFKPEKP